MPSRTRTQWSPITFDSGSNPGTFSAMLVLSCPQSLNMTIFPPWPSDSAALDSANCLSLDGMFSLSTVENTIKSACVLGFCRPAARSLPNSNRCERMMVGAFSISDRPLHRFQVELKPAARSDGRPAQNSSPYSKTE